LYRIRGHDIPRNHKLTELHRGLAKSDKDTIAAQFDLLAKTEVGDPHNLNLYRVLRHCENLFPKARYGYEKGNLPRNKATVAVNLGLPQAIKAVQQTILQDHLEFFSRAQFLHRG
jgi:hypothetical protein